MKALGIRFGKPLMQAGADLVGRVGLSLALVAGHQHSPGNDARDAGQADPLPNPAHRYRLFLCALESTS